MSHMNIYSHKNHVALKMASAVVSLVSLTVRMVEHIRMEDVYVQMVIVEHTVRW